MLGIGVLTLSLLSCHWGRYSLGQVWSKREATTYLALSTACPQGRFGPSCAQVCTCGKGAACDPVSGTCICPPGKMGVHCEHGECQLGAEHAQSSLMCH